MAWRSRPADSLRNEGVSASGQGLGAAGPYPAPSPVAPLPSVNAPQPFCPQDAGEGVEAGFVLSRLGSFPTQLHPVLHQIQGLHKNCGAHPGGRQMRSQGPRVPDLPMTTGTWQQGITKCKAFHVIS